MKQLHYLQIACISAAIASPWHVFGQEPAKGTTPQIQDNSFLIEEAYNQEPGVVQHISTFSRAWNSKDWNYTFTQEWPWARNWRHQLSYTITAMHAGGFSGSGSGLGDILLNYRYQVIGSGETRVAVAPRVSVLAPTGDVQKGRGTGGFGIQTNIPVSVVLHPRLVTHWNIGGTIVPRAYNPDHQRAATVGYNFGQSFIVVVNPRFNLMLETSAAAFQTVAGSGTTASSRTLYTSPGARWAFNLKRGLQIVPGIAVPIGVGPTAGARGVFIYLSFEHPFGRSADR